MPKNSHGTKITFASGFLACITAFVLPDQTRIALDTSCMDTDTWRTKIPGKLIDQGEMTVDLFFEPENIPPINGSPETIVIQFTDGATWSFTGFMTATGGASAELDGLMTQTVTITVSGKIEITGDSSSG